MDGVKWRSELKKVFDEVYYCIMDTSKIGPAHSKEWCNTIIGTYLPSQAEYGIQLH